MKRTPIFLIFMLLISMILPLMTTTPNTTQEELGIRDKPELPLSEVTPGYEATIIRVSDDSTVKSNTPTSNFGSSYLEIRNGTGSLARSWLKFNLTHIPDNFQFTRATVNLFVISSVGDEDYPIGAYFSENDTWTEDTITWNNQPEYDATPTAVIDSPASPDMFQVGYWYEWDITAEVTQTLEQDGMLSLLIRLANENTPGNTWLAFGSRDWIITDESKGMPCVSLEYAIPETSDIMVDGFSESPQIDYISNANPDFSWTFNDADTDDIQKNFELEVWNNSAFDDTLMMQENNSEIMAVHDTGGAGTSQDDTFNVPFEWRAQYKWPGSMVSHLGVVDKLYFEVDALSGIITYSELAIFILCVEDSSDLTTNFESNYDGVTPIQVLNQSEYTAIIEDGFLVFDIENSFVVQSSLSLIIELRHMGASGTNARGYQTNSGGSMCWAEGSGGYYSSTGLAVFDTWTQGLKLELVSDEILSGGVSSNFIPFGLPLDTGGRFMFKYNQSLIDWPGTIDRLLFHATGTGDIIFENFTVHLGETPVEGRLSHTDFESNYGGVTPVLVLDQDEYVVRGVGSILVIDLDDLFYYSNTYDLLIELQFDAKISGSRNSYCTDSVGAYRTYNTTAIGDDTLSYDLSIDFIYDMDTVTYSGSPFVNATTYYWRVRTCDPIGVWSSWETSSFKFEVLTSLPAWTNLVETPEPLELGDSMTVSVDVTHISSIIHVDIEYEGMNHTMSNTGDSYSHTWTPGSTGSVPYTIYMESFSGTWNTVSDDAEIVDTTSPTWDIVPADKVLEYGEALNYQLYASDFSGIANWTINDVYFDVIDGLVTNVTVIAPGGYYLNVTVTDNEGNSLSGTFIVAVLAPTTTTTITTTTTTTTATTGTNTTTTTSPISGEVDWVVIALVGVIVILILVIIFQNRKT